MSILTLSSAPAVEPISATEVKLRLRIDHVTDDTPIDEMIGVARQYVEEMTDRQCVLATRSLILDGFWTGALEIPRAPLKTASIKYLDTDGALQILASSVYTVDIDSIPGRIYLAYGQSWPATRGISKSVTITFTCGEASAAEVPAGLKQIIYLLVGHLYENREATSIVELKTVPMAVDALIAQYKVQYV